MHPDFPVLRDRVQITAEWWLTVPTPLNVRNEDGSLVLCRPGWARPDSARHPRAQQRGGLGLIRMLGPAQRRCPEPVVDDRRISTLVE